MCVCDQFYSHLLWIRVYRLHPAITQSILFIISFFHVILQDYFNLAGPPSNKMYLPPLKPKIAFEDTPRSNPSTTRTEQEISLPKTFTTRKGALLLFSEDFAAKLYAEGKRRQRFSSSAGDLSQLRTMGDLTQSILSYGSSVSIPHPLHNLVISVNL